VYEIIKLCPFYSMEWSQPYQQPHLPGPGSRSLPGEGHGGGPGKGGLGDGALLSLIRFHLQNELSGDFYKIHKKPKRTIESRVV
jgi:hypothetical protein